MRARESREAVASRESGEPSSLRRRSACQPRPASARRDRSVVESWPPRKESHLHPRLRKPRCVCYTTGSRMAGEDRLASRSPEAVSALEASASLACQPKPVSACRDANVGERLVSPEGIAPSPTVSEAVVLLVHHGEVMMVGEGGSPTEARKATCNRAVGEGWSPTCSSPGTTRSALLRRAGSAGWGGAATQGMLRPSLLPRDGPPCAAALPRLVLRRTAKHGRPRGI